MHAPHPVRDCGPVIWAALAALAAIIAAATCGGTLPTP